MTTLDITTNNSKTAEWLQDILLPAEDRTAQPTIETVTQAMKDWNAAEIGDAISSIIIAVALKDGKPNTEMARRYASDSLIQQGVGLRRGSRLHSTRNRAKLPMAWAALRATLQVTFQDAITVS